MQAHTRKHLTKGEYNKPIEGSISAEDYFKMVFGDFPSGALNLSGLRYREDLSQKELGDMIGVKQSNISLMERGKRPIGKEIAKRLAKVFNEDYRIFL